MRCGEVARYGAIELVPCPGNVIEFDEYADGMYPVKLRAAGEGTDAVNADGEAVDDDAPFCLIGVIGAPACPGAFAERDDAFEEEMAAVDTVEGRCWFHMFPETGGTCAGGALKTGRGGGSGARVGTATVECCGTC